ncbi:MAG TPA: AFG1/ZapE family ATPase [Myxococcota bacterium]|nr:AFG1/ZapE family ATPase [Myxococcota bacterium]
MKTPEPKKGCPKCKGLGMLVGVRDGLASGTICDCVVVDGAAEGAWCPRCSDTARIELDGRWLRCKCRLLPDRIALYDRAHIPARHGTSTFMAWNMRLEGSAMESSRIQSWCQAFEPGIKGFVLWGAVGRGKTHLMCAALREIVFAKGARVRFVEFTHLLQDLRRGFDSGRGTTALIDEVMDCEVLAIDELGKGRNTEWELAVLDELVSGAYNGMKTLVATSNYRPAGVTGLGPGNLAMVGSGKQETQTLGDRVGERAWSRLNEMTKSMPIGDQRVDFRLAPE